ncbi:MAG: hypothetical protein EBR51_00015 [Gammaproteobacteria bacterium]|jgi:hypothetical protein|nr:hypothetical protein [Gammaproteobacteria bacterium]
MPPSVSLVVPDNWNNRTPQAHDTGGALLKLGVAGSECVIKSQTKSGEERRQLLLDGLQLRSREFDGWLAVRTKEYPGGDLLSASMAAVDIGVIHLQLCELEKAREWTERARELCPASQHQHLRDIDCNLSAIDHFRRNLYVDRKVRLKGLVRKPQYNGRCGVVLCHEHERWKVLVDCGPHLGRRVLLVHPQNLTLLCSYDVSE